jgi:hypothetical protein
MVVQLVVLMVDQMAGTLVEKSADGLVDLMVLRMAAVLAEMMVDGTGD